MPKYIDAEDFFDTFPEIDKIPYSSWAVTHIEDVRPVIRGKWKRRIVDGGFNADWYCSKCGWRTALEEHCYNFCPNCGSYNGGNTE